MFKIRKIDRIQSYSIYFVHTTFQNTLCLKWLVDSLKCFKILKFLMESRLSAFEKYSFRNTNATGVKIKS